MNKLRALLRFVGWGSACRDCEVWNITDCEECLGILTPRCPKGKEVKRG